MLYFTLKEHLGVFHKAAVERNDHHKAHYIVLACEVKQGGLFFLCHGVGSAEQHADGELFRHLEEGTYLSPAAIPDDP